MDLMIIEVVLLFFLILNQNVVTRSSGVATVSVMH